MKIKKIGNTEMKVYEMTKPLAEQLGLDIWDVQFEKEGASFYLRVFIDKQDGITIEDCENLTRPLNKLLDETDPIPQSYFLEVGSAGLERELLREEHFSASIGKTVRVKLIRPIDNEKEFIGELLEFNKEIVIVKNGDKNSELQLAGIANIKLYDDYEY